MNTATQHSNIAQYLDSTFSSLPASRQVIEARAEIETLMNDKLDALVADGVDPEAALAQVTADFGDITELASEFGLEEFVDGTTPAAPGAQLVDAQRAESFLSSRFRQARLLGYAIMMIGAYLGLVYAAINNFDITSGTFALFNDDLRAPMPYWTPRDELVADAGLIAVTAWACWLVLRNYDRREVKMIRTSPLALPGSVRSSVVGKRQARYRTWRLRIAAAAAIAIAAFLAYANRFPFNRPEDATAWPASLLSFAAVALVAAAIALLVRNRIEKNAFRALLKEETFEVAAPRADV